MLKVENSCYLYPSKEADISELVMKSADEIDALEKASVAAEQAIYDKMLPLADEWQRQAEKTVLCRWARDYQKTKVEHSANKAVNDEYGRQSIDEDGRTLTLADVQWTEAGDYYTATAEYTGTAQRRYVKSYTATAEYAGEVSKTTRDEVVCTAIFSGTPIETELPDVYRTEQNAETDTTRILLIVLPVAIGAIVVTAIAVRVFEKRRKR